MARVARTFVQRLSLHARTRERERERQRGGELRLVSAPSDIYIRGFSSFSSGIGFILCRINPDPATIIRHGVP